MTDMYHRSGFWICSCLRILPSTNRLTYSRSIVQSDYLHRYSTSLKASSTWIQILFYRSIEYLLRHHFSLSRYLLSMTYNNARKSKLYLKTNWCKIFVDKLLIKYSRSIRKSRSRSLRQNIFLYSLLKIHKPDSTLLILYTCQSLHLDGLLQVNYQSMARFS